METASCQGLIGYVRVSTAGQAASGLSLEAQEARIRKFAEFRGIPLLGVQCDPGVSGKSLKKRPGLLLALEQLEEAEGLALVVTKLDRLTRSIRDLGELLDGPLALDKARLISLGEAIDTTTAAGRLSLAVLVSVLQWEREAAGERTATALEARKARGLPKGGRPPFGWRWEGDSLVRENSEVLVLKAARKLRAQGLSFRAIAEELQTLGHVGRRGEPISEFTLRNHFRRASE